MAILMSCNSIQAYPEAIQWRLGCHTTQVNKACRVVACLPRWARIWPCLGHPAPKFPLASWVACNQVGRTHMLFNT